jgi:hypothetical protein
LTARAWSVAEVARALILYLRDDGGATLPADGPGAAAADSSAAGGPAPRA